MKWYPSFRFQLDDYKKGVFAYYLVIIAVTLFFGGLSLILSMPEGAVTITSGISAATGLFLFVAGLCSFKETFLMGLQNGVGRKSCFWARQAAMGVICAVLAVLDEVLTLLLFALGHTSGRWQVRSLFEEINTMSWKMELSFGGNILLSILFSYLLFLALSALGYFITLLFYRLPVVGKVLVGAGVPLGISILPPLLKMADTAFFHEAGRRALYPAAEAFGKIAFGAAPQTMAFCLVLAALFSLFSWLLLRRAPVK